MKEENLQKDNKKENRRNYMNNYRKRIRADLTSTPKSDEGIPFSYRMDKARKTQTEVFLQFKNEYPDEKMGQRAFEQCKPYFVRTAQFKDKVTCCCRQHVEMRSLFKSCMQFRKRLLSREGSSEVKLYESLSELVDDTLCTRSANTHQHKISCLDRLCSECGVCDKMIRKLVLLRKSSSPAEMFQYLKKLLETFPAHQFRAYWQSKQMKSLVENLPIDHCVTVHDFS
ncbi:unnamed protein product [Mytilus coruscus]|uniref:Uncharacterized protein n=1 Tax=Mytilus coruscus TaxID=42192 RepID=A0A6J7ZV53_MYTCO|nr:unnamed protein product [Mytilus coruscus]